MMERSDSQIDDSALSAEPPVECAECARLRGENAYLKELVEEMAVQRDMANNLLAEQRIIAKCLQRELNAHRGGNGKAPPTQE